MIKQVYKQQKQVSCNMFQTKQRQQEYYPKGWPIIMDLKTSDGSKSNNFTREGVKVESNTNKSEKVNNAMTATQTSQVNGNNENRRERENTRKVIGKTIGSFIEGSLVGAVNYYFLSYDFSIMGAFVFGADKTTLAMVALGCGAANIVANSMTNTLNKSIGERIKSIKIGAEVTGTAASIATLNPVMALTAATVGSITNLALYVKNKRNVISNDAFLAFFRWSLVGVMGSFFFTTGNFQLMAAAGFITGALGYLKQIFKSDKKLKIKSD